MESFWINRYIYNQRFPFWEKKKRDCQDFIGENGATCIFLLVQNLEEKFERWKLIEYMGKLNGGEEGGGWVKGSKESNNFLSNPCFSSTKHSTKNFP